MVDIKGFFDHVHHKRLIKVLYDKGFPLETCRWVESFVSDRHAFIRLDDFVSSPAPIHVRVPQGSPVSPTLACIYASEPLEDMLANPIFTETIKLPVSSRAYVDDYGFLAISPSTSENNHALSLVLNRLLPALDRIGLRIDPAKTDIMHFSWQKKPEPTPPLNCTLYNKPFSFLPPSTGFARWLGVFLNKKLTS